MGLLSGTDLEAFQAFSHDQAVNSALALAGAYICPGIPDVLSRQERTVAFRVADMQQTAYGVPQFGVSRLSAAWLGAWPITDLTSVKLDGEDISAVCSFSRFAVTCDKEVTAFWPSSDVEIVFATGYTALPSDLKTAILTLANSLHDNPEGISRAREDVDSVTYAEAGVAHIPKGVRAMLEPYRLTTFGY